MRTPTPGAGSLTVKHPARYSDAIMPVLAEHLQAGWRVLDPFAGTGRIHELANLVRVETPGQCSSCPWHNRADVFLRTRFGDDLAGLATLCAVEGKVQACHETTNGVLLDDPATQRACRGYAQRLDTVGVELEPEWAQMHPLTLVGNALRLDELFGQGSFDAVTTSPVYGNRMSDHHEARDDSKRITYRHSLGRPLSPGSTAGLPFGPKYKHFHEVAWWQVARVLANPDRPRRFVLNTKNFYRDDVLVHVTEWHHETLATFGFELVCTHEVETPSMGFGANSDARVPFETVAVFTGPSQWTPAMPWRLL